jgi:hypothetical protein
MNSLRTAFILCLLAQLFIIGVWFYLFYLIFPLVPDKSSFGWGVIFGLQFHLFLSLPFKWFKRQQETIE